MAINACMDQLLAELHANNVENPLAQRFMLAAIWDDLCRIAGEEAPAEVRPLFEGRAWPVPSEVAGVGDEGLCRSRPKHLAKGTDARL